MKPARSTRGERRFCITAVFSRFDPKTRAERLADCRQRLRPGRPSAEGNHLTAPNVCNVEPDVFNQRKRSQRCCLVELSDLSRRGKQAAQ